MSEFTSVCACHWYATCFFVFLHLSCQCFFPVPTFVSSMWIWNQRLPGMAVVDVLGPGKPRGGKTGIREIFMSSTEWMTSHPNIEYVPHPPKKSIDFLRQAWESLSHPGVGLGNPENFVSNSPGGRGSFHWICWMMVEGSVSDYFWLFVVTSCS